jgi:23S rRNA pseudouridine1911/1915/1917 synthase
MQLTIPIKSENYSNLRLDKFLTQELKNFTRGEIIRAIKQKNILKNNTTTKPSAKLKINDQIQINISPARIQLKPNQQIKLDIIFENKDFLIINKSSGLQVHPSAINQDKTLANALIYNYPEIKNVGENWERPGIVHRLDKDTSGILIVAKNNESFEIFKKMFQTKKITKTYLALVWGKLDKKEDLINLPIAKTPSYQKQKIAQGKFSGTIRSAQTEYKVLQEIKFPNHQKLTKNFDQQNIIKIFGSLEKKYIHLSLLETQPKTGRTHQIRVHFSHLGHPLVNDYRYYKKIHQQLNTDFLSTQHKTFFLHSTKINFIFKNKKYDFQAEMPHYFQSLVKK